MNKILLIFKIKSQRATLIPMKEAIALIEAQFVSFKVLNDVGRLVGAR